MEEKIKILLAEDDTNLGMLLKEYLRAKGFETVLCEDGEVAYEAFLNQPFDILWELSFIHCANRICMPLSTCFVWEAVSDTSVRSG